MEPGGGAPSALALTVRVLSLELIGDTAVSRQPQWVAMTFGGEERRVALTQDAPCASWDLSNELMMASGVMTVQVVRKKLVGVAVVCSTGALPIAELQVYARKSTCTFPLVSKGRRGGKITLEFSTALSQEGLERRLLHMHEELLGALSQRTTDSSSASSSAWASLRSPLSPAHNSEEVLGYVVLDQAEAVDVRLRLEQAETEQEAPHVAFNWVLGPTQRQLEDCVLMVQRSWKRIQEVGNVGAMVEQFYTVLRRNPSIARLFEKTSMEHQKAKLTAALKLVLDNITASQNVVEELRALAVRHVGYGALLEHYNDVAAALLEVVLAVEREHPCGVEERRLEFAWRLALTMVSTTMMEAARPLCRKLGKLPPGLELLGGDGVFPACYYQFNERFQRAGEGA